MDANRFDRLTLTLGRRTTRRGALGLFAGIGLLGGVHDAAAKSTKKHKKPCPACKKRKHGKCKPVSDGTACGTCKVCQKGACGSAPDGTDCGGGQVCMNGGCACPDGQTTCKGACVDLATDAANCGKCGLACASGVCVHGACNCDFGSYVCPTGCACTETLDRFACQSGQSSKDCSSDDDCQLGSVCLVLDPERPASGPHACGVPCCPTTCDGKTCGDNGCGGTCGDCGSGATCDGGQCVCSAGNKPCGEACIDNSWCCTEQECAADQICPTPGQGRCCTVTGRSCPPADSVIQCCTGRCGDRGNTLGKCCIAAGDPCIGAQNCCNGISGCTTNQQGDAVCL